VRRAALLLGSLSLAVGACTSLAGLERLSFEAAGAGGSTSTAGGGGVSGGGGIGGAPFSCTPGEVVACYEGPPATDEMGVCQPGEGVCNASGDGFVSCVGQILPVPDDCGSPLDEDCSGEANDHCATLGVMARISGTEGPRDVATGRGDEIAVVGHARGTVSLGGKNVICADTSPDVQALLMLLDNDGSLRWGHCWGSDSEDDELLAVTLDAGGQVFAAGYYESAVLDIEGTGYPRVGTRDALLMSLDSAGSIAGVYVSGDAGEVQEGQDVAVDSLGNPVFVGTFSGTLNGMVALDEDIFVLKFSSPSTISFSTKIGESGNDYDARLALAPDDDMILAGRFYDTLTLGNSVLADPGASGAFVARLDADDASADWATAFYGEGSQVIEDVVIRDEVVAVVGRFRTEVDFGAGLQPAVGEQDMFVATLDASSGAVIWAKTFGAAGALVLGHGVSITASGDVIVAAEQQASVDYGGGPLPFSDSSTGSSDGVLVAFDSSGGHRWSRVIQSEVDDQATGLTLDSQGRFVAIGESDGTVDFGSGPLVGDGIFVVRGDP
jgi:hypothetical protein